MKTGKSSVAVPYKFVLTDKGKGLQSEAAEWRPSSKRGLYFRLLNDIEDGFGITPIKGDALRLLRKLLREGYVKEDSSSTEEIISTLPTKQKKVLGIYSRIARERPVSDEEVDEVFNLLKKGSRKARSWIRLHLVRDPSAIDTTSRLLSEAKTRSDKVVAIDAVMGLWHERGSCLDDFTGDGDRKDAEEVRSKVNKVLNRLANE